MHSFFHSSGGSKHPRTEGINIQKWQCLVYNGRFLGLYTFLREILKRMKKACCCLPIIDI